MAKKTTHQKLLPDVQSLIFNIRGERVILDSDLARIYGVKTARLNQQGRRNRLRFPEDFVFQLTDEEYTGLMLQNATSIVSRGGRRQRRMRFHPPIFLGTD